MSLSCLQVAGDCISRKTLFNPAVTGITKHHVSQGQARDRDDLVELAFEVNCSAGHRRKLKPLPRRTVRNDSTSASVEIACISCQNVTKGEVKSWRRFYFTARNLQLNQLFNYLIYTSNLANWQIDCNQSLHVLGVSCMSECAVRLALIWSIFLGRNLMVCIRCTCFHLLKFYPCCMFSHLAKRLANAAKITKILRSNQRFVMMMKTEPSPGNLSYGVFTFAQGLDIWKFGKNANDL